MLLGMFPIAYVAGEDRTTQNMMCMVVCREIFG